MTFTRLALMSVLCCTAVSVYAQQPPPAPPKESPQAEAGEPRADTSQKTDAQSEAGEPRANTSSAAAPASPPKPAPAPKGSAKPGPKAPNAADHVELSTATVTGDREQPKVMYIVPWKRSDIGDLEGKPMNSLVDEVLSPVDRDVFRREVRYYNTVKSDAPAPAGAPPPDKGEK